MHAANRLRYSRIANAYDAFLTFSGFKRGIENFLDRLEIELPPAPKILDAGCGTGLLARYLARRFPEAEIYATDIDAAMLRELKGIAMREGIGRQRLVIAQSDLRAPGELRELVSGRPLTLPEAFFDAITVSGALEHVPLEASMRHLARLLKPGGAFINIGLRKSPTGTILGMMYRCRPYEVSRMRQACLAAGMTDVRIERLRPEDFPANLSRIAVIATKRAVP